MVQNATSITRSIARLTFSRSLLAAVAASLILFSSGDLSKGLAKSAKIQFELNSLKQREAACRITFVITNGRPEALSELAYEVALFDRSGGVDRLTTFDFGSLPGLKTRVKRFDLNNSICKDIGRLLINRASKCVFEGSAELATCETALQTTNKTDVKFGL